MTDDLQTRMAELKGLLERASPAPWSFDERYDGGPCHIWMPSKRLNAVEGGLTFVDSKDDLADLRQENAKANAALIVAMRNALPDLLARIEAQAQEIEGLREALEPFVEHASWQSKKRGVVADLEGHSLLAEHFHKAKAALTRNTPRKGDQR